MSKKPLFILAGNGSNYNRGCEAILRGTVRILRECFDDLRFLAVSYFPDEKDYQEQCHKETDEAIVHCKMHHECRRFDPLWFLYRFLKVVSPGTIKHVMYKDLKPHLDTAKAVLALGGDNYSIDFGNLPKKCTDLDDLVLARSRPMIIWGASVGPFSKMPEYEKYMKDHLSRIHIFAREPLTVKYLTELGLGENVHRVGDPAFLMMPVRPAIDDEEFEVQEGSIALNLSPLISRFVTGGDLAQWISLAAEIVKTVSKETGSRIYLVPHVFGTPANNDYLFLEKVLSEIPDHGDRIILIPSVFNAPELKWIISRMSLFAGARMHATIASWSCHVPTLSFSYSMKSRGLNEDIYGHTDYCMGPNELKPRIIADRIGSLLKEADGVRRHLKERIPHVQRMAMNAGEILRGILQEDTV